MKGFLNVCFPQKGNNKDKETKRRLKANDRLYNAAFEYANNFIRTSKYKLITFVPQNLFEQFQRLANFYFLVLMILQLIPQVSSLTPLTTILPLFAVLLVTALKDAVDDLCIPAVTSQPWETTFFPLFFVLCISAVKEGYDDLQRHRSDNQVNNRPTKLIRDGQLIDEKWHNVMVGDIVKLNSDEFVTADLYLLSTSEPYGLCYIETAELDGETNLKARQALPDTQKMEDRLDALNDFNGEVECEAPNQNLSSFNGKLTWNGQSYAIDNDKMLLRGCILRNTKWCFGLVIFAGKETKLMQNSGKTKFKRTSLDRFLNVLIVGIVIFLLSMCVICTVLCAIWEWTTGRFFQAFLPWETIVPTEGGESASVAFISFLIFFSYAILLNTVVPISLYVSVEVIRFCHSYLINWDKLMYHAASGTAARSRTTTLNEELGQIQYIFSDKTGTLTQNIMTFNKCSINGVKYGDVYDSRGHAIDIEPGKTKPVDFSHNKWFQEKFMFYDETLKTDTDKGIPEVVRFWRLIALCHTVMPDYKDNELEYQAQSPDEEALTNAARNFGFAFKSRTPDSVTIEVCGKEETHELLCILDFNNVRKRMSVITREPDTGHIVLYCKGADTMILERVSGQCGKLKEDTTVHLDKFASEGLRTLCTSYKIIDDKWYSAWSVRHKEATVIVGDHRQDELDKLYEEIEQDMVLLGATAIEDKLQDGVPEAIANLANANIKIWVLTGDKEETAINIGYSCRLLTEDMQEIFVVSESEDAQVYAKLLKIRDEIRRKEHHANNVKASNAEETVNGQVIFSSNQHAGSSGNICEDAEGALDGFALVINGHSLTHALKREELLVEIGCQCRAVICCRVTPLQKAMVVDLIKRHKKAVTLSIGDGANDVSMIKMAHIGVGISGQEGMQAVLASDFSIAQFRYLERLLLVHGRWSYLRMSKFLRYFFYKNFAFTLAHFWFAFFCGYSAQTVYDPFLIASYNLVFTSMPVIALGIFDQDVDDSYSLRHAKLYIPGQFNLYFNMRIFVYSVLHGLVSSLILFFVPYGALNDNVAPNGRDINDVDMLAFTVYSCLVVVVTAQIALDTAYWTFINHICIWGSLIIYYLFTILLYEALPNSLLHNAHFGVAFRAMATPHYWLSIALTTVLLLLPVVAVRFFWFDTHPTLSDRIRVRQNYSKLKKATSEMPLRPFSRVSTKSRRRASIRSGYAFAHQQGFGDLITKGLVLKALGTATNMKSPKRLSPIKEQATLPAAPPDPAGPNTSSLHSEEL